MEWKQWHTSKDQYLEAKKKVRRLFNRPNVKQKVKDLEILPRGMIRNVICLSLQRGWSKLIRILLVSSA